MYAPDAIPDSEIHSGSSARRAPRSVNDSACAAAPHIDPSIAPGVAIAIAIAIAMAMAMDTKARVAKRCGAPTGAAAHS